MVGVVVVVDGMAQSLKLLRAADDNDAIVAVVMVVAMVLDVAVDVDVVVDVVVAVVVVVVVTVEVVEVVVMIVIVVSTAPRATAVAVTLSGGGGTKPGRASHTLTQPVFVRRYTAPPPKREVTSDGSQDGSVL